MFGRVGIPGVSTWQRREGVPSDEDRARKVERFIGVLKGVLRFVDKNIMVNCSVFNDDAETRPIIEYYHETRVPERHQKGVIVYVRSKDRVEPSMAMLEINKVFPHQQKQSRLVRHARGGEEVYLTREGKFVSFERSGVVVDLPAYEARIDCFTLSEPREVHAIDLVRKYPDFEEELLFHVKLAITRAIKENEKRWPILKKVIDHINLAEKEASEEQAYYEQLEKDPNGVPALLGLARFQWHNSGDARAAKATYQRALDVDPGSAETVLQYADFLLNNKEIPLAKQLLAALIRRKPRNAAAYAMYASAWMYEHMQERSDRKIDEHGIMIMVDVGDPVENQRYEEYYEKAIELEPGNADAHHDYGFFLFWIKRDYDKSIKEFQASVDTRPEDVVGHLLDYAGILNLLNRDPAKVESLYRQAIESAPGRYDPHMCYVDFLLWTKHDIPAAEGVMNEIISSGIGGSHALLQYARFLHHAKHDLAAAELWYEKALDAMFDTDLDAPLTIGLLASVQLLSGKADVGKKTLQRLFDAARSDSLAARASQEHENRLRDSFLLLAHFLALVYSDSDVERASNLASIKILLSKGIVVDAFGGMLPSLQAKNDLMLHAEMLKKKGDPTFLFVRQLSRVIIGERKVELLEKYPEWRIL
ncbi:MAG: tetratricopeptide repeat protein [Candidatus Lokiarchaeota archaeon]|nr:tetratricopeptide repeat protein [Candidatus Lokiarchaeota archaeon]